MNNLNVFTSSFLSWRRPRQWVYNIRCFFRGFKYAYQRATKGYCKMDLWDLDFYYKNVMISSLKDFANNLQGAPIDFYDEINDSVDRWRDYLNEVALHLELSLEDSGYMENPYEYVSASKDADQNKRWLKAEKEKEEMRKKEFQIGWEMLGNTMDDLWD